MHNPQFAIIWPGALRPSLHAVRCLLTLASRLARLARLARPPFSMPYASLATDNGLPTTDEQLGETGGSPSAGFSPCSMPHALCSY